ncbi:MAG: flagellar hook-basal body complex protein [Legionella sp.]|nr:MAG: flagellar hook-basal body complex protein [Legionella sp.]
MNLKGILVLATLAISTPLCAGNLFNLAKEPLIINSCPINSTDNPIDIALLSKGFFVVSNGHKDSEVLFTRFGKLFIDKDSYLRTDDGNYLLSINKKSDAKHLHKIKISTRNLPPQATRSVKYEFNLLATTPSGYDYQVSSNIYDSLGSNHLLNINLTKTQESTWKTTVHVDDIEVAEGFLRFDSAGELSKQEGLKDIRWPAGYGMNRLSLDFKFCTQYASPFQVQLMKADGYSLGVFLYVSISNHGEVIYFYNNGEYKTKKDRIAVALFTNPNYLEKINSRLYRPSERSGQPMIHWVNGEQVIQNCALEAETCLA